MAEAVEIYAGLTLHKAGKEINEENLKKVLEAVGAKVEEVKIKAFVASLEGINVDEAIKEAAVAPVAVAPAEGKAEEKKKEEKPKEEKKSAEEAAEGLSSLFG